MEVFDHHRNSNKKKNRHVDRLLQSLSSSWSIGTSGLHGGATARTHHFEVSTVVRKKLLLVVVVVDAVDGKCVLGVTTFVLVLLPSF